MAEIKLLIPDDKIQLVTNAICNQLGYQDVINGQANPETKAQFAKRMVVEYVKNVVYRYEFKLAEAAIQTTSINIT